MRKKKGMIRWERRRKRKINVKREREMSRRFGGFLFYINIDIFIFADLFIYLFFFEIPKMVRFTFSPCLLLLCYEIWIF